MLRLVLAFSDSSLGGTSRSALLYARLWRDAGSQVLVYSPKPMHEQRLRDMAKAAIPVTTSLTDVQAFGASLVHLHHAAPSAETINWTRELAAVLARDTVVLTHNVFGQVLPVDFGPRVVVGVLGHWVGAQYIFQGGGPRARVRVLPNPQDFSFFRPPTARERNDARTALGIDLNAHVVLRVGSPAKEKWSTAGYDALVRAAEVQENVYVRLIGAPADYESKGQRVSVVHRPVNDEAVRREYWAADVFAHWAERGESFGNVIVEALGTGLPVVYRAVRTRDNTPSEFRDIAGFEYVAGSASWVRRSVLRRPHKTGSREHLVPRYGSEAIQSKLRLLADSYRNDADDLLAAALEVFLCFRFPRIVDIPFIAVRHNPLAAMLKRHRLRGKL